MSAGRVLRPSSDWRHPDVRPDPREQDERAAQRDEEDQHAPVPDGAQVHSGQTEKQREHRRGVLQVHDDHVDGSGGIHGRDVDVHPAGDRGAVEHVVRGVRRPDGQVQRLQGGDDRRLLHNSVRWVLRDVTVPIKPGGGIVNMNKNSDFLFMFFLNCFLIIFFKYILLLGCLVCVCVCVFLCSRRRENGECSTISPLLVLFS